MIPTFAVVGRVNEGKSSVVATLTENGSIAIGPDPGTTKVCQRFDMTVRGEVLFSIVDTPGFQEPEAVLAWFMSQPAEAHERPQVVGRFLDTFRGTGRFVDECELLEPIMAGAHILYVVDGSHPFRASYESELDILRWTGRPRMALINQTTERDYVAEWTAALTQYFNVVRTFNAQRSLFQDRMELLNTMRILTADVDRALERVVEVLEDEQDERLDEAARTIARLVIDVVTFKLIEPKKPDVALSRQDQERLVAKFNDELRSMEVAARRHVERLFRYDRLERTENPLEQPVFEKDLFSRETWQVLGLSKAQLISFGALSGGLAGGALDVMVGGASFLMGTAIGTVLGAAGTALFSANNPEGVLFGAKVYGSHVEVGPHRNPNFPFIVLDRALLHFRAVVERTHAMRTPLALDERRGTVEGLLATLDRPHFHPLRQAVAKIMRSPRPEKHLSELAEGIRDAMAALMVTEPS